MYNFTNTDPVQPPQRKYWSEIFEASCARVMAASKGNIATIQSVWPICIAKTLQTHEVLQNMWPQYNSSLSFELASNDHNLFVLLGSDHGKGILRALARNPHQFGCKVITKATIVNNGS